MSRHNHLARARAHTMLVITVITVAALCVGVVVYQLGLVIAR